MSKTEVLEITAERAIYHRREILYYKLMRLRLKKFFINSCLSPLCIYGAIDIIYLNT